MFTGQLIEELIEDVQQAEQKNFIRVTEARRPAGVPLYSTYIYEFGRREVFEVA